MNEPAEVPPPDLSSMDRQGSETLYGPPGDHDNGEYRDHLTT